MAKDGMLSFMVMKGGLKDMENVKGTKRRKAVEIHVYYYSGNTRQRQIRSAIDILNGAQNYFFFVLHPGRDSDVCEGSFVDWERFCTEQPKETDEYSIYITEKPFDDNWFSHEGSQYAVITTDGWEKDFAPPSLGAYLVYQIAQAVLNFAVDLNEEIGQKLFHASPKGCMLDFCGDKSDIKLGMIAGSICPHCKADLLRYGINEEALDAIERILVFVRAEAIGKPIVFDKDAAFVVMRFSTNDENDNAYKYGIECALERLGIDCIRADNGIPTGQLLENIEQCIERSRFVIAKVDSNNLNVYFELGLAMGQRKDVLLISEESLVLRLPADLRNWKCLTYMKGNYEELRDNIVAYFRENYHYE